jgi:Tol biopolymer transport system component
MPDKGEPQVIMTMRRKGSMWSAPVVAPFSGTFVDGGPVFSPDGRRLYFHSAPPAKPPPGGSRNYEIWFVGKQGNGWSERKCLGLVARFPDLQSAGGPSITRNGALYFTAHSGICRAELVNGEYAKPQLLPPNINKPGNLNWTPFIAAGESYLLFSSNRRSPNTDAGDLYISRRQSDGSWSDPVSLGEPVNSERQERFPMLSPDGKYLFFTRPTPGHEQDVYWVDARSIPALPAQSCPARQSAANDPPKENQ